MSLNFSRNPCPWAIACVAVAVLSLAGCGGGGGTTTTPAAPQSVSGVVIDGPILGATVCLDLNHNGTCDAGEPTSSATDAQGNYTISGLTDAQVNAGAPLIAVIPGTATDSGVLVGTAYQMTAPAGKGAVISPITTLVQANVEQGMTRSAAEAAVAAHLQVAVASLYNNYITSPSSADNATMASSAPTIASTLTPNYWVRQFDFGDASNYFLRYFYTTNVPNSAGEYSYYDERIRLSGGNPSASSSLYDTALLATATGWKAFSGATASTSTTGSPFTATWGNGYAYSGTRTTMDVGGRKIADVVAMAQNLTKNRYSSLVGVNATALTGTMPAGAKIRTSVLNNTATPVAYRVSDGYVDGVTNLAGLIAAYPVPGSPTSNNTASMAGLHYPSGCGSSVCLQEWMRVAFGAGNVATYYLCDTVNGLQTNCGAVATGTYTLGTAADGSTPIMTFAGLPAAASVQSFTTVFVQRSGHVYYGWQEKLDTTTTSTWLNKVAFEALAQALGIAAPTFSVAPSAYAGTWSSTYSGSDTGACDAVAIDAVGHVSGTCTSTGVGGTFVVSGSVTSAGAASFNASGLTSSGSTFSGSFTTTAGSGTWANLSSGFTGKWMATKQ